MLTSIGVSSVLLLNGLIGARTLEVNRSAHKIRLAISYPWTFSEGTSTSRATVFTTLQQVQLKGRYGTLPNNSSGRTWAQLGLKSPSYKTLPTVASLSAFGSAVHADVVFYGRVHWHTRSIWVGAGPKTISTATVDAFAFDVHLGRVVYSKTKVEGRSDERDSDLKLVADVLLTPIVSAVSGGPATPREQRAVEIALAKAYHDLVVHKPGTLRQPPKA